MHPLAAVLPDLPRWVETRGMLLSGQAEVLGFEPPSTFVVRVRHGALSAVSVAGWPAASAVQAAVDGCTPLTPVIAQVENAAHVASALPGWTGERAVIHVRPSGAPLPAGPVPEAVRVLSRDDLSGLSHLPAGLRHEITHGLDLAPIAAVFLDGRPVSFCYPCWRTETLWDVSVDSLEGYRGRRLAVSAFRSMADRMAAEGRSPVWGAMESNVASLRLAARLAFRPVAEIVVFSQGHWAFLSGGFEMET